MPEYRKLPDLELFKHGAIVEVLLYPPSTRESQGATGKIPSSPARVGALVDTGANCCGVLSEVIASLGVEQEEESRWNYQNAENGSAEPTPYYLIDIAFRQGPVFQSWPVIAREVIQPRQAQMLIGRDILRDCKFIYDGLKNGFSIWFPPSVHPRGN